MFDSAHIRRRGAQDFEGYYDHICASQGSAPSRVVKSGLSRGMLDFNADHISLADWAPILSALSINKHLQHVSIRSCHLTNLGAQSLLTDNSQYSSSEMCVFWVRLIWCVFSLQVLTKHAVARRPLQFIQSIWPFSCVKLCRGVCVSQAV